VLEIGGGSGAMAAELLAMFPALTMCVTDYDEEMVAVAAQSLLPFGARAEARQADATALPFEDGSFDTVLSWIMLHHTIAWEKALAEASRVLRPGGRLIGYDLLANRPSDLLHRAEGEHLRMIRPGELDAVLAQLPFDDVAVGRGTGGFVVRFHATASASASPLGGESVVARRQGVEPPER
jgi:SAM-dependent methyltransferase